MTPVLNHPVHKTEQQNKAEETDFGEKFKRDGGFVQKPKTNIRNAKKDQIKCTMYAHQ